MPWYVQLELRMIKKTSLQLRTEKYHICFVFCWLSGDSTMVQSKTMTHVEKSSTQSAKDLKKLTLYSS